MCGLQLRSPAVHHYPGTSVEDVVVEVGTDSVGKRYQVLLAVFSRVPAKLHERIAWGRNVVKCLY